MNRGVVFPMNLKKGPTVLHTWFMGKDNTTLSADWGGGVRSQESRLTAKLMVGLFPRLWRGRYESMLKTGSTMLLRVG